MTGIPQRCSVCSAMGDVESVTIRVYRKRSQAQYSYRPCRECRQVLAAFLEGGATRVQRGMFAPPESVV